MYEYKAFVYNVVDGDTIDCVVSLGFTIEVKTRFRMLLINAPEMKGSSKQEGIISKDYLSSRILNKEIILKSFKPEDQIKTDSFGRWLATVYLNENGELININQEMIDKKYATYFEK